MILYRFIVPDRSDAIAIVNAIRGYAADGTLVSKVTVKDDAATGRVEVREEETFATLHVTALDDQESAELRAFGNYRYAVEMGPADYRPDAYELCLEILTAVSLYHPTDTWVSDVAAVDRIKRVAPLRRVLFSDRTDGYLLMPDELSALLEST